MFMADGAADNCTFGQVDGVSILVAQIAARVAEISRILPDVEEPDPMDILRWPGVVLEPETDTEPLFEDARELLAQTLAEAEPKVRAYVTARAPSLPVAVRARSLVRIGEYDLTTQTQRTQRRLEPQPKFAATWFNPQRHRWRASILPRTWSTGLRPGFVGN